MWKHVSDQLIGYGNGHRAVLWETITLPYVDVDGNLNAPEPFTTVYVYKGSLRVGKAVTPTIQSAKQWAEKNYLKEKK